MLSVIGKTKPTKPKQVKPSQTFGYTSVFLSGIAGASSTWREHLSASATGSEEMNDYDVFTKTCMNLGPRYLPRRTKTRSKLGDPQTMQNRLHRWTSRGPPFVDAKMVQKQQFLNKGLNEEQLAWNFAILVLMVGPVKPATSPRIRRSTSISYKSGTLGPGI